jgi:hypothetical protein
MKLLYLSAQSWHKVNVMKQNPIQGGCKELALFKRRRKVSFIKAWRALQSDGVGTYAA